MTTRIRHGSGSPHDGPQPRAPKRKQCRRRLRFLIAAVCLAAPLVVVGPAAAEGGLQEAVDDFFSTGVDERLEVPSPGVLANDSNVDSSHEILYRGGLSHGGIGVSPPGGFSYSPDPGFSGTDSFDYCIGRSPTSECASNVATVFIEVCCSDAEAVDDTYSTPAGERLSVAEPGVLANDDLVPQEEAEQTTPASHGSAFLSLNGSFGYTPDPGFSGTDSFTYCISPPGQTGCVSNRATVTIEVVAPVAVDDHYVTPPGERLEVTAPGVMANDTDLSPGSPGQVAQQESAPSNGTLFLSATGAFFYTPNAGFTGRDSFTYCIQPGFAGRPCVSNTATVAIHVIASVLVDDVYATPPGQTLTVADPGVLANDTNVLSGYDATQVSAPSNGSLGLAPSGGFTYTPNPGFVGFDTFTYCLTQASPCVTNTATVTIQVAPATSLVAQSVIARLQGLQPTLYLAFEATLTSDGAPVPGRAIAFSVRGRPACTAITNMAGTARCASLVNVLDAVLAGGYTATFAGDPAFQPSSATGQLVVIR